MKKKMEKNCKYNKIYDWEKSLSKIIYKNINLKNDFDTMSSFSVVQKKNQIIFIAAFP